MEPLVTEREPRKITLYTESQYLNQDQFVVGDQALPVEHDMGKVYLIY